MTDREEQFNGLPAASIEAKAVAIESDSLVLKAVETGELLHWPLNKINKAYQIGENLKLALYNGEETPYNLMKSPEGALKQQAQSPTSNSNETEKRKLLEQLLN